MSCLPEDPLTPEDSPTEIRAVEETPNRGRVATRHRSTTTVSCTLPFRSLQTSPVRTGGVRGGGCGIRPVQVALWRIEPPGGCVSWESPFDWCNEHRCWPTVTEFGAISP